jgi:hypothetical protein
LALEAGYAATAGSMSRPGYGGFLFPTPFFISLLNGGTIGEAFLFSQPYLDWTIAVFGDPLVQFAFPATDSDPATTFSTDTNTVVTGTLETESWRLVEKDLARSIAYYIRKTNAIESARDIIVSSVDVDTAVDLLYPFQDLYSSFGDLQRQSEFNAVTNSFLTHLERRYYYRDLTIPIPKAQYVLELLNQRVSELIYDVQTDNNRLVQDNVLEQGYWEFETPILDDLGSFTSYYFELEVSKSVTFSVIDVRVSSRYDPTGWYYEEHEDEFSEVPIDGVTSSYVGRRIQYQSQPVDYLDRATKYYFRIRQVDANGIAYGWSVFEDVIYS